jgi:23S rRNA (adenine2503-C2)-methyltransferase
MGTGEPFGNYENVSKFIKIINDKHGLHIGMRNITVSTCGIIPKIKAFAEDFPQVNLAISLHASNDSERKKLMPIANKYGYDELLLACHKYTEKTGRRITFEYILIAGKNDDVKHADELATKLQGLLCHVNLIPMNEVSDIKSDIKIGASSKDKVQKFLKRLQENHITSTVRRELGTDINAACGQLRLNALSFGLKT